MSKIRGFSVRLNPRKEWDRVIIQFLERIPPGERTSQIKRLLYEVLTGEQLLPSRCQIREVQGIESKLDSLFR